MYKINFLLCFALGTLFGYIAHSLVSNTPTEKHTVKKTLQNTEKTIDYNKIDNLAASTKVAATNAKLPQKIKIIPQKSSISQLSSKIEELNTKYQNLQDKYQRTNNRLIDVTLEIESLDESDITDEQMMALVNDDFSEFRRGYRGAQRDKIFDFHQLDEDLDWGYDMQTKISDFILTHYSANDVRLRAIACKEVSCELLIEEVEKNAWGSIMESLTKQAWWKFRSTNSSSRSGENESVLIYLFMSK